MRKISDKESSYNRIISLYGTLISRICYFYAGKGLSFDDLYQDVCMTLWQNIGSFRGEAKISTWLYRLTLNTCLTSVRRETRHQTVELEERYDVPDLSEGSDDRASALYRAISMLGPVDKGIVMMRLDEKSYDEIAAVMGISKANVAVKLHRIKAKMAKFLDNERD